MALGRAGDAVQIWGHVMPAIGPASRRNLAPVGAAIAILFLCLTIASALLPLAIAHEDEGGGVAARSVLSREVIVRGGSVFLSFRYKPFENLLEARAQMSGRSEALNISELLS